MYKKILVPIDGSDSSNHALVEAMKMGKIHKSEIYILSVAPEAYIMKYTSNVSRFDNELDKDVYNITKEILADGKLILADYDYPHYTDYRVGDPASEIIEYAKEKRVNLIVMGNRGMGIVSRTLLGSVSNKVINNSPISVLVVKSENFDEE